MFLKQVPKDLYEKQVVEINDHLAEILRLAKTQISLLRTLKDAEVRKSLIANEKALYQTLKQLCVNVSKHTRSVVKKDVSPNMKSGFAKQMPLSAAMCRFSGWSADELKSRNDVTRVICDYIKTHELNSISDKRQIIPDRALAELFGTSETITYNYIQRCLQERCFAQS